MARICIVTEELPHVGRTGGIGAAMHELALVLAEAGHSVDLLYYNLSEADAERLALAEQIYAQSRIRMTVLDWRKYIDGQPTPRAVSFAIYRTLTSNPYSYDFVHFPDYKGLGFYSQLAKLQGLAFPSTHFVVQIHGPTRWTIEANNSFFSNEEQLAIDYMEMRSIALADKVVAPSQYIATWVNDHLLKAPREITVIRNLCGDLKRQISSMKPAPSGPAPSERKLLREIVVFGRHEDRKGIDIACQALSRVSNDLAEALVSVSFIGNMGMVSGQSSLIYLHEASKNWGFNFDFHFDLSRDDVAAYLFGRDDVLVLVPSPHENSPYAVLEPLMLGVPVLFSSDGGAKELIDECDWLDACCTMSVPSLTAKLREKLVGGVRPIRLAVENASVAEQWRQFHSSVAQLVAATGEAKPSPLVTVGITHYERPEKLFDAVLSIIKQDYDRIELIVCDDGSQSDKAIAGLSHLEVILRRVGGRLVRRENGYLGAARNSVLAEAKGDFVIFLDDDDIAAPNMVSTLVRAASRSGADAVSCLNYYMPENRRGEVIVHSDIIERVSYFPLGGPIALSPEQNAFGSATALFRREAVLRVGGYSEVYGVGHEDYELYINLAIAGCKIEVCPEPLFFYEVGRPSMVSATSLVRNFNRCFQPFAENLPSDMVDYVNLAAGRSAFANQQKRNVWLNDQKPGRELRHELMSTQPSLTRCLKLAAKLAEKEGNRQAAAAFRSGMALKEALSHNKFNDALPKLARNRPKNFRAKKLGAYGEHLSKSLIEARFLFALGRGRDALSYIDDYVGTHGVTRDLILTVAENVEHIDALKDEAAYKAILAEIKDAYTSDIVADAIAGAVVAGLTGDEALARAALDAAIESDSQDYLRSNGDVAEAVTSGTTDALRHFIEFGAIEGRGGFERTIKAYRVLTSNAKLRNLSHRGVNGSLAAIAQ